MIKVTTSVQSNVDTDKFIRVLVRETGRAQEITDQLLINLTKDIERMIMLEIQTEHPIGLFMATRTQINVAAEHGRLEFMIHGKPESEVNDFYTQKRERNGESINKKDWHLWEFHEFGGHIAPVDGKLISFQKAGVSKPIVAYSRKGSSVTKYKGRVRSIINSLTKQIQMYIEAVLTVGLEEYLAASVNKASQGKIRSEFDKRALLKKLGVSDSMLKKQGISVAPDSIGRPIFKQQGIRISSSKVRNLGRKS